MLTKEASHQVRMTVVLPWQDASFASMTNDFLAGIMKKRLRKKLRLREFQEMGFHTTFELADYKSPEATDTLLDSIIAFAEANSLFLAGGLNFFYVTAGPRRSVTEAQRLLFTDWLMQQQAIIDLKVLPLSDAWYVKDEEWADALPHELIGRSGLNS